MLNVSKCMRAHGLANFPDPTLHAPTPGNGVNAVIGRNGVFLALGPGDQSAVAGLCTRGGRVRPAGREGRAPVSGAPLLEDLRLEAQQPWIAQQLLDDVQQRADVRRQR